MIRTDTAFLTTQTLGHSYSKPAQAGTGSAANGEISSFRDQLNANHQDKTPRGAADSRQVGATTHGQLVSGSGSGLPKGAAQNEPIGGDTVTLRSAPIESGNGVDSTDGIHPRNDVLAYWTPERLAGARPMPVPSVIDDPELQSSGDRIDNVAAQYRNEYSQGAAAQVESNSDNAASPHSSAIESGNRITSLDGLDSHEDILDYWTPDKLSGATPMPVPGVIDDVARLAPQLANIDGSNSTMRAPGVIDGYRPELPYGAIDSHS
jgi:hypothetical protein